MIRESDLDDGGRIRALPAPAAGNVEEVA